MRTDAGHRTANTVFRLTTLLLVTASMALAGCEQKPPTSTLPPTGTSSSQQTAEAVIIDGNLKMPIDAELYFGTFGTVEQVYIKKGDQVKAGMLLASLDHTLQRIAVDEAQTNVTLAKNQFEKRVCSPFMGGPHYDYINFPGASDTLETIEAELGNAIRSLESQKYEAARAELSLIKDDVIRTRKMFNESYIMSFPYGLDEATAIVFTLELKKAQLALERAKEDLKKTEVITPIDAVVADVLIEKGDQITPTNYATTPVIYLLDTTRLEMEGSVDELDVPRVARGKEAVVTVDSYPRNEIPGKVAFISPAPTIRGGVVAYKITLIVEPPAGLALRNGMSATAKISGK